MTHDLERRSGGNERAQVLLRGVRRTIRRVAQIHGHRCGAGNDVVRDTGLEARDRDDLDERKPADDCFSPLERKNRPEPVDREGDRTVGVPRPSRVAAPAVEREASDDVPEAARVNASVCGLEQDHERCVVHQLRRLEEGRKRIVLGGKLFPPEEENGDVDRPGGMLRTIADELERDGDPTLHVACAQPVNCGAFDTPWKVVLCRHRVVVAREHDQRSLATSRRREEVGLVARVVGSEIIRHEREEVIADLCLVPALGWDVHELERALGEALGERGHPPSLQRHNPAVTARQPDPTPGAEPERGFVLGVFAKGVDGDEELAELRELARTAGVAPVAELVQHRNRPDPRTFVGKGKLAELKTEYAEHEAEVLIVDDELSPTQQRTLEDALKSRVVDRTQLILDIFAQHARSAEGKLQVELAQLEYNLPRMRGMWQHLERLGGGVGTRGPGESQLESDRRMARTRVSLLKRRLRGLGAERAVRRKERKRSAVPTIALAGYTNVGKSTLLNALTGAHASVDDRLFETLDPTTRGFDHVGKRYLVTDTVGFIRRLPTQLVEGFAATLEETLVADLVLHVADGSLGEARLHETIAAVQGVLDEIRADDVPVELVLNKVDLLDPLARRRLQSVFPRALQLSAETGEGIDELKDRIAELFSDRFEDVRLLVPYSDGKALAALYDLGAPIAERRDTPDGVRVRARLPRREVARFARFLVAGEPEAEIEASAR